MQQENKTIVWRIERRWLFEDVFDLAKKRVGSHLGTTI
jgi:hypothetical protein